MTWVGATARAALAAVVGLAAAGCGATLPTSAERAAADTAATVCGLLRDWNNELSASLNATSDAITDDDDPTTANGVLLDGYDELVAIAEGFGADLEELDLPVTPERDRLLTDLRSGVAAAVEELEGQRDEARDLPPITVERQAGAIGGAHVGLEKARSLLEPPVARYDDPTVRAAFAAEPGCAHVVRAG